MTEQPPETCIVITVPDTSTEADSPALARLSPTQVLVRLPGHIDPADVAVDFRPGPQGVWTPSQFFEKSVEVRHSDQRN